MSPVKRPVNNPAARRSIVMVRLSAAERLAVIRAAKKAKRPVSTFMRETVAAALALSKAA